MLGVEGRPRANPADVRSTASKPVHGDGASIAILLTPTSFLDLSKPPTGSRCNCSRDSYAPSGDCQGRTVPPNIENSEKECRRDGLTAETPWGPASVGGCVGNADRGPGRDLPRTWGFVNGPHCGFEFRGLLLQPVWRFTERRSTCRLSKLGRRLGQTEEQQKSPLRSVSESPLLRRSSPTLRGCAIRAVVSCLKPSVVEYRRSRWWSPAGEVHELSYFGGGYIGGADMGPIPSNLNPSPPATDRLRARPRAASAHTQL